jgi:hypothetical protein
MRVVGLPQGRYPMSDSQTTLADRLANDSMLHPLCSGTGLHCPDVCVRCGATADDPCGDQDAQDYQLDALRNGRCEIVRIR